MWGLNYRRLFDLLDTAVLERSEDGLFRLMNNRPDWLPDTVDGKSVDLKQFDPAVLYPHIANYLIEAQCFWSDGQRTETVFRSSPWLETGQRGESYYLEATAVILDHHNILLVSRMGHSYDETLKTIRTSRDKILELDRLIDSNAHSSAATDEAGRLVKTLINEMTSGRT